MEHYKNLDLADIVYFCESDLIEKIEQWKNIIGYEGLYMASNLGRIKSLRRKSNNWQGVVYKKEKIKRQNILKNGYLSVGLTDHLSKTKTTYSHILVAIAFFNHKPEGVIGAVVDHKDNNPLNCCLYNLQLITHRENCSKDKKNKSSKYTGVYFRKERGSWVSVISIEGNQIRIASYITEELAYKSYCTALDNVSKYNGDAKEFRKYIKSLL